MTNRIRFATPADAAAVAAIYSPYCSDTPISFEVVPPTVETIGERMRKICERFPWLVCENAGKVIGYAYASPHHERAAYQWSVDVSVYIDAAHHRLGVGRALYSALLQMLTLLGYFKAYAGITLPNPASENLHASMGFKTVGVYPAIGFKLGAWHDVVWLELTLQPPRPSPDAPLSIAEGKADPRLAAAVAAGEALLNDRPPLRG